jgi:predicted nuclease of predicted toxin-antitoxin system
VKGLADENFPGAIVRVLRELGWDVVAATEKHSGVSDSEIFEIARRQGRIVFTFDKDFGDLYRRLRSRRGVVSFSSGFVGLHPPTRSAAFSTF